MGPLANYEHMQDGNGIVRTRLDAYLKPTNKFDDSAHSVRPSVRFLDCPQYCEISCREDFSKAEVSAMWYTESEYNYMKAINNATVRLMMSGQHMNENIYCTRGLVSSFSRQ